MSTLDQRQKAYPGLDPAATGLPLRNQIQLVKRGWTRPWQYHQRIPTVDAPGQHHDHEDGTTYYVVGTDDGWLATPTPVEVSE